MIITISITLIITCFQQFLHILHSTSFDGFCGFAQIDCFLCDIYEINVPDLLGKLVLEIFQHTYYWKLDNYSYTSFTYHGGS